MFGLRRLSMSASLSVTSDPVDAAVEGGAVTDLYVAAVDDDEVPSAHAFASMRRPRMAEHEEVWAQLFIDGVFVQVSRAADLDPRADEATFVARFEIPELYLDAEPHRVQVRFVRAVSRVVAKGSADLPSTELPETAEADFTATLNRKSARALRLRGAPR
jgi:hypothetical protein